MANPRANVKATPKKPDSRRKAAPAKAKAAKAKRESASEGKPVRVEFEAELYPTGPKGEWLYFDVPRALSARFPSRGLVKVAGTVNGKRIERTSLMPDGKGSHCLGIRKAMRQALGLNAGDRVRVVLEQDVAPRVVEVPEELAKALEARPEAKAIFDAFAFTHRKEYAKWVAEAKKPETRARRVEKAVEMISAKRRFS